MTWHALQGTQQEQLGELAERFHLHPLHIEDCLHGGQAAKMEEAESYSFFVLKPMELTEDGGVRSGDVDLFLGHDYLVSFEQTECEHLRALVEKLRPLQLGPAQIFYRLFDGLVDSYAPILQYYSDQIDLIEDQVLSRPDPDMLQKIFALKRGLIEMRRVLSQTRDVASHVARADSTCIDAKLRPYFRDIYDHVSRHMEAVEMARDLLSGSLDIYLSSVANRTNETMKILALMSTISLPALVVSGFFGMNFEGMPWEKEPHGLRDAMVVTLTVTSFLVGMLKWRKWV